MDLKSLILSVGLGIGYAAPAEAVKITKVGSETPWVNFGKNASFDIYQVITEKGDTLESIAAKFEKMGIKNRKVCSENYSVSPEDLLKSLSNSLHIKASEFQKGNYTFGTGQDVTKQPLLEGMSFKHYVVNTIYSGFRILQ